MMQLIQNFENFNSDFRAKLETCIPMLSQSLLRTAKIANYLQIEILFSVTCIIFDPLVPSLLNIKG